MPAGEAIAEGYRAFQGSPKAGPYLAVAAGVAIVVTVDALTDNAISNAVSNALSWVAGLFENKAASSGLNDSPPIPGKGVLEGIANGHASGHLDQFGDLGVDTPEDLAGILNDVVRGEWTQYGELKDDREYYYDPETNILIIIDPNNEDGGGTAMRPDDGQDYVDTLD